MPCRLLTTLAIVFLAHSAAWSQINDPIPDPINPSPISVRLELVADGLTAPNRLTHANDASGRLFVVDQIGQVRVMDGGVLQATPYLDVTSQLATLPSRDGATPNTGLDPGFDERGLLGLAFHPGFNDPQSPGYRKFYTYHSEGVNGIADFTVPNPRPFNHQSVVTEWTVNNTANNVFSGTRRELIRIDEPQFNHNSGMLAFGHDNNLYITIGDGGAGDDQGDGHNPTIGNGQDLTNVLGTMLRIDPTAANPSNGKYGIPATNPFLANVDPNDDTPDEIFAYGLRNAFRYSVDRLTGELIIADVGQNDIEEINRINPTTDAGANFGWRVKEGTFGFDPKSDTEPGDVVLTPVAGSFTDPLAQYDHTEGAAVIGGYNYRGSNVPALDGLYVFGDFGFFQTGTGRLFVTDLDTPGPSGLSTIEELIPADLDLTGLKILGFGEDENGELYVLTNDNFGPSGTTGKVYRFAQVPEPATLGLLVMGLVGWRRILQRP